MAKRKRRKRTRPPLDDRHYTAIYLMTRPFYDKKLGRKRWLKRQEVADMVGVSRMQLWRWEQRKDFQREKNKELKATIKRMIDDVTVQTSYAELAMKGDEKAFQTIADLLLK